MARLKLETSYVIAPKCPVCEVEGGTECGEHLAKLLAADASWEAANVCLQTFGGFGWVEP